MYLAKVIGNVEARIRLPGFDAQKLLLLQPIDFNQQPIRWVVIALDCTNSAGVGSIVTFVEGREAANPSDLPVDACITSLVDSWDYKPTEAQA
jgi:microcompartment protein CcmK/EutM